MMRTETRQIDLFTVLLEVLNPALVMGMVGSLAFFLLDVAYRGPFDDQLRWTLFFFVFAIVLVARISFTMGADKAAGYGIVLAGVTFLATMRFVAGLGAAFNLLLIIVIAASAYLLTKDTTRTAAPDQNTTKSLHESLSESWQLISKTRDQRRTHGMWIVYFALAAVPIFGVGQSLISIDDLARRQTAFWRMTLYIGCALGLLLTTALVNLRQYAKARKLKVPRAMTMRWLAMGGAIIAAAMAIAAFLPRPQSETPLISAFGFDSPERDANRVAVRGTAAGKGEGSHGGKGAEPNAKDSADGRDTGGSDQGKARPGNQQTRGGNGERGQAAGQDGDRGQGKGGDTGSSRTDSPSPPALRSALDAIQTLVRWIVIAAIALIVAVIALRFLAHSAEWAKNWWNRLMGLFQRKRDGDTPQEEEQSKQFTAMVKLRPFHSFSNPFADGTAQSREPAELVRYSFAALEAWARSRSRGRSDFETPLEFAGRLDVAGVDVFESAQRLAGLYSQLAYAHKIASPDAREVVRDLWQAMETAEPVTRPG